MRTLTIVFVVVVLGGGLVGAECAWLQRRAAARAVERANQRVAAQIELARVHLEASRWDEAIRALDEALAVEAATQRDEASALLDRARRGQADALLAAARLAVAHKDAEAALRLLHAYETHPRASDLDRARRLREDVERAVSDVEADRLLVRLSEDALAVFAQDGQLTQHDGLHTAAAREMFRDTLRGRLADELCRRQALREIERRTAARRAAEHAQRIAQLRATPAYLSLSDFVARTRETQRRQQEQARQREEELAQLFEQLDVNDAQEQATVRANLTAGDDLGDLRKAVEDCRAAVKRAYRASPQFDAANRTLFDQLVDRELNALLASLASS